MYYGLGVCSFEFSLLQSRIVDLRLLEYEVMIELSALWGLLADAGVRRDRGVAASPQLVQLSAPHFVPAYEFGRRQLILIYASVHGNSHIQTQLLDLLRRLDRRLPCLHAQLVHELLFDGPISRSVVTYFNFILHLRVVGLLRAGEVELGLIGVLAVGALFGSLSEALAAVLLLRA